MLTIPGTKHNYCDGVSRRNFLKIGTFGAGLTLAEALRLKAQGGQAPASSPKAAIMIYLFGGPPHMDMYDLKPDAPREFRGKYSPIKTNVPGIDICELFPIQAKMFDKLALLRSVISNEGHNDSETHTGFPAHINRIARHPSMGSVVSRLRGGNSSVPPFVSLRIPSDNGSGADYRMGLAPGFLGTAHGPFIPTPGSPVMEDLRLANGVTLDKLEDRKNLLASFNSVRRNIDTAGLLDGLDSFKARALETVTSGAVLKALDLTREDAAVRARYKGVEEFLTARRLVEAGVGFVTFQHGGWDTHDDNFGTLDRQLPTLDRGISNLIQDLCDRGLDKDVVTVVWGEFGRSPKLDNKPKPGRDHWPQVMSVLMAGGGLKMGQVIGSTTARAETPKDRPCRVPQVLSTMYQVLGIDPVQTFPNESGRPMYILEDREPIAELL